MALTYRKVKGSALTIDELDANFAHFTGSHSITGSLTVSGSIIPAETNGTLGTADAPWKELFVDGGTIYFISGSSSGSLSWSSGSGFNFGSSSIQSLDVNGDATITGSLTVSGSNTLTNIGSFVNKGTATLGGTVSISGSSQSSGYDVILKTLGTGSAAELNSLVTISEPKLTNIAKRTVLEVNWGNDYPDVKQFRVMKAGFYSDGDASVVIGSKDYYTNVHSDELRMYNTSSEVKSIILDKDGNITARGNISGSGTVTFDNLPTSEPTINGSLWISGSSPSHPNSGYLMIYNP